MFASREEESPTQRTSFCWGRKRGRPAEAKFSLTVCAPWGSTVNVLGGQALAVLAQSCDSTGALKPSRRGCFCGACNRTTALQRLSACVQGCPRGATRTASWPRVSVDGPDGCPLGLAVSAAVSSWGRSYQLFGHHSLLLSIATRTRSRRPRLLAAEPSGHPLSLPIFCSQGQADLQPRQILIAVTSLGQRSQKAGCHAARKSIVGLPPQHLQCSKTSPGGWSLPIPSDVLWSAVIGMLYCSHHEHCNPKAGRVNRCSDKPSAEFR